MSVDGHFQSTHSLDSQRPRLFRIYNHYRLLVSLILAGLLLVEFDAGGATYRMAPIYQATVLGYLGLNLLLGLVMLAGHRPRASHITLSILIDIVVLHLLVAASTGITSGLANLVIVSVAAGNILAPSRLGLFYAALAALGSLGVTLWSAWTFNTGSDDLVRAGSLGILYFAAAFLLQYISRRLIRSEALASSRARSIAELEQINQQIIHRMLTGIIATTPNGDVRLANAAAHELLFGDPERRPMQWLPRPVRDRLKQWLSQPDARSEPFQMGSASPLLQANFTRLGPDQHDLILVFIDDLSKVTQQAQQMKLASLGRLTAGISHQIRNPLGAISHAAQLLAESPNCDEGDRRMVDIIQRHSGRVNSIIENILDLSRRRESQVELMDVHEWLTRFIADYQPSADQSGRPAPDITLTRDDHIPPARFDPGQLEQVLINLCDNGLRYSLAETGHPTLAIHVGITNDGERCHIDVRDDGPGLSDEQREHLFEPFYTTDQGGTGLGLYLARELCEANQAHLGLLKTDGPGCCFRITFAHQDRLI
ncbi:histidine kinase [Tamilnaduibacter salinus]|uniref:histidine kinase n=1 Tax=Tamilnaduibacter salinus TaxID=1484056 RepID=A0A2A2I179_9GAMM|nr:ATP-binding protein [Tamilnaduibacter salinus]PAV25168.1 histidine kinase [Tamilnaduibacter salinus]